jgi:hypothetical protein
MKHQQPEIAPSKPILFDLALEHTAFPALKKKKGLFGFLT